ncbi:SDR family NAD(P)-dependent oxidoreductase [Hymenobacter metallilatus]|uniref:SDR family NAD(P)-dependent oxidoreductase n=1 Tax=Hymenobacter metallilatus TaxID=2493666 RepID=A0A3R9MFG3_9BACT|nr:SDR family NAD(P)-dependent oxidoreductase [Hymenobacter metallilatus]RSK29766.1 SDR family NAD(P)-dependent oxidoreductase [Hymenobacter metallilatus]
MHEIPGVHSSKVNSPAATLLNSYTSAGFKQVIIHALTQAFLDLLQKSEQPRIVNVSSGMASLSLPTDPTWKYYPNKGAVYYTSKAALNMYTIILAYELRDTEVKVNAVDPGFTATNFNNHCGTGTVEEAGARLVKYALIGEDGPNGKFFSEENNPETGEIPW